MSQTPPTQEMEPVRTRRILADNVLLIAVYGLTAVFLFPVMHWLLNQTTAQEQLTHAFMVLVFTGALLAIEGDIRLKLRMEFGKLAQGTLVACYVAGLLASFSFHAPFLLLSLALFGLSLLLWLFGGERKRFIFAIMGAFVLFTLFAMLLPLFDWPLRSVAGQFAASVLRILGDTVNLALTKTEDGPILLLLAQDRPFNVAAECNGFGLLSSSLLMAVVLSIYYRSGWVTGILSLTFAVLLSLTFNTLRIVAIVLIAPRIPDDSYFLMHEAVGLIATYSALGILYVLLSPAKNSDQTSRKQRAKESGES